MARTTTKTTTTKATTAKAKPPAKSTTAKPATAPAAAKATVNVVWEPTAELIKAFNPENPRDHFEEDIKETATSLLEAGWAEIGISRQRDGYLLGGHGRVQGAEYLSQQDLDWFSHQWEKWVKRYPEREAIATANRDRFTPQYWLQCPVNYVELDELTQKATMIRLNNSNKDGKDNPKRIAALLAQMGKEGQKQAGWDTKTAESFMAAFIQKKQEPPPPAPELQNKQFFQRPDATDYSGDGDDYLDDATAESGPVHSNYDFPSVDGDDPMWGETDITAADGSTVSIANVQDMEHTFGAESFDFTKQYSETRAILYLSQDDYAEYKQMVSVVGDLLGIDKSAAIAKVWRSQAVMALLRQFTAGKMPSEPIPVEAESSED